jgi:hypothetical protein
MSDAPRHSGFQRIPKAKSLAKTRPYSENSVQTFHSTVQASITKPAFVMIERSYAKKLAQAALGKQKLSLARREWAQLLLDSLRNSVGSGS